MDKTKLKTYKAKLNQLNEYAFSSNRSSLTLYVQTPLDFDLSISWLDNYLKSFVFDGISVLDIEIVKEPSLGIIELPELANSYSVKRNSSFYLFMDNNTQSEFDRIEHYHAYMNKPLSDGRPLPCYTLACTTILDSITSLSKALNRYGDTKVKYALFGNLEYNNLFKDNLKVNFDRAILFNWSTGDVSKGNNTLDFTLTPDKEDNKLIMHALIGSVFVGVWYDKDGQVYTHFWRKDSEYFNESIFEGTLESFIDAYKKEIDKRSIKGKFLKFFKFNM